MTLRGFRARQRTPTFVIPRDRKHAPYPDTGAGIHAITFRERTSTAIPPPTSTRRPHFVCPAKAHPEPRYGAGIPEGCGRRQFSHLGVPAAAGMSDWYENALKRLSSAPATPRSSFQRKPESRGEGRGECSAGACPPLGSGLGMAESPVRIRRKKPQLRVFISWCAGTSRNPEEVRRGVCNAGTCPRPTAPPAS